MTLPYTVRHPRYDVVQLRFTKGLVLSVLRITTASASASPGRPRYISNGARSLLG